MRTILLLGALALFVVAATGSATAIPGPVGAGYTPFESGAQAGVLTLVNAEGRCFTAYDVYGAPVMDGISHTPVFDTFCPNSGEDPTGAVVRVHIEPGIWLSLPSDPEDFHWDR